jgi:lipopolysaccharide biosynthesis regulator YciM
MQMEAPEAALKVYDKLLEEQPTNADFVFERARIDLQRDAAPAAKQRIAALLAARKNDETIRAKALEFYEQNRLTDLAEEHLVADAAGGGEEPLAALANFYFAQRREDDARRALQRLVHSSDPPAKQAAARWRIAQLLRAQNDLDPAIIELRAAVSLQPENREVHLALGDLLAARGDYPGAQFEFEKAVRVSQSDAERIEADQKFFESFRAQATAAAATARTDRAGLQFLLRGADATIADANPELGKFLHTLEQEAVNQITEAAWLRLARWRMWNREDKSAIIAAEKALVLNPKSVAAGELLVKIEAAGGPSPGVVKQLMELAAIDPANRASYERRAGQFELQGGRVTEALAIFDRLVAENPGNVDALTDLALAQQRAERWPEALATWRQVYAASPVSRRKEALAPLLRVLERLSLHEESAALQLKALEAEPNERERFVLFNDLLGNCQKHGQLDWLRAQFEKRRQLRADDYFTEIALGRILKASGQAAAAFEMLADASYAAPNPAEALPDLIREAEDLHKLDAAVKLQAQLLRLAPQDTPDGFEKLAQLQEKNFEIDEAVKTWERVVAKFPRDTAALNRAVDFQLAWGTSAPAQALLRKARSLEPSNLRTLSTLATLDLETGETAEAENCLEQIIKTTPPEKSGDAVRFPAVKPTEAGRLQSAYLATVGQRNGRPTADAMRALRSFWVEDAPDMKAEREVRLNAIRQLAQLHAAKENPAARAAWIERWKNEKTAPSEALWALFYAGAGEAALDRVEAMLGEHAQDPKVAQAFIWLALQTQEYKRLGAWLKDRRRTPSERDYLFVALGQALDGAGRIDPKLLDALFAEGTHLRLWQAAMLFAGRNCFREAIQLGQRVFENATTQRAVYCQELAHWHLFLGEVAPARAVLLATISSIAETLDAPVCSALREYYLLLPESERSGFIEKYLSGLDAARQPLHTAIATALLRGLVGQEKEARAALDRLLEMRALTGVDLGEPGNSGIRHLRFLIETGAQLQALKLENLAVYFWEKALADDALVQLQDDQAGNLARDLRQRLCTLRALTARPGEVPALLEQFARLSTADGVAPLAGALTSMGAHTRAIAIYRHLWQHDPDDAEALRNLLNACRTAGDNDTAEAALRASLRNGGGRMNEGARREFMLQLADLLEHNGDLSGACATLGNAAADTPNDTRLLLRLGQLHARAGRIPEAISALQRVLVFEPGNSAARIALSSIYEAQGRLNDALALFQTSSGPETDAQLAQLQLKNGQPDAALSTIERIAPPQHITPALGLATVFAAQGDRARARVAIQGALGRTGDARLSFPLQCKLIELLAPEDGPVVVLRELRRLRRLAGAVEGPGLLGSYLDFAAPQAVRLHVEKDFAGQLRALWAEGAGPASAGAAALAVQLEAGDQSAAEVTLGQLLVREDAGEPPLQNAAEALEKAGQREGLARVQERLVQINPLNEQNALQLARTLHQLGRTAAARGQLELLALRAALNEDSLGKVAQGFAEIGDTARASALYAQAARGDRFARNWNTLLQYARLQTRLGDFSEAKKTLRMAFSNPANRSFVEIIEWLVAAGLLDRHEAESADLELTPPRRAELRRALVGYFEKAGQPANALALAEAHPEIVQPAMGAQLRKLAGAARDFERAARLLEKLAAEAESPGEFSLELARLDGDWAQAELTAGQAESALGHLRTAHERHPELGEIALPLSSLQAARGDRRAAMETLESFLALATSGSEIETARAQLAKLRAGG